MNTQDITNNEGGRRGRGSRQVHGEREVPEGRHGRGRSWEGRVRRGDIRGLLLAGLIEGPAHGYELMSRLEESTGGRWRPSPGSVYPMLQMLEDEGLARRQDDNDRKVYELTDEGRKVADPAVLTEFAERGERGRSHGELHLEVRQLHMAARQVGQAGDPEQVAEAVAIVKAARQSLYKLLAG